MVQTTLWDYRAELQFFISVKPSANTRSSYGGSLRILEDWLARKSLALPDLTPELAAQFVTYVRDRGVEDSFGRAKRRTTNSVRSVVAACSSFYAHLEKRFAEARNPFRGLQRTEAAPVRALLTHRAVRDA